MSLMSHFHQGSLNGGRGGGLFFGAGGGPWSTKPRTGAVGGGLGPNTIQPRPRTTTNAPTPTRIFTSRVIVRARSSRSVDPRRGPAGRGGEAADAAAISSAWARVVPQWQAGARRGTRRPQIGHDQV